MKDNEIIEFTKYNKDNLRLKAGIKSKTRYANFIII